MHILEIPSFFPPYGGLFCLDQAKALQALGHEVRILSNVQLAITIGVKDYLCLPYRRYEYDLEGVTVFQSYQRGIPKIVHYNVCRWVSIVCSMFRDYVRRYGRPDILHAHCAKWAGYAAMTLKEEYHIPYVITDHLPLMLLEEEYGKAPSSAWQIPLLRCAYERADMVLPVSEELVDDIACYYEKNYKWQYLSNIIDTEFFIYKERQPQADRPFCFCCLADYYYRKGYDVLFEAYRQLQILGCPLELHIAGLYTDGKKCKEDIKHYGIKGVKTYGRLDKERVRELLYQCDALVLASRSEVQPLVLLEAMRTGIPVVSTECIPQCLRIGEECLIVPIGDATSLAGAMEQVMEMSVDGKCLSEKIYQLASPQVVGRKLEAIFKEITVPRSSFA